MGKLMQMGGKAIIEAGDAAEKMGQVLNDEAIAAAEEYRLALDDIGDAAEGVKIKIGTALIPSLADAINTMNDYISVVVDHAIAVDEVNEALDVGAISQDEYNDLIVTSAKGTKILIADEDDLAEVRAKLDKYTARLVDHSRPIPGLYTDEEEAAQNLAVALGMVNTELAQSIAIGKSHLSILQGIREEYDTLTTILDGPLGSAQEDYDKSIEDLNLSTMELQEQVDILESKRWLKPSARQDLADMKQEIEDNKVKAGELAAAHEEATKRIILGFVQQAAAADGVITQQELDKVAELGKAFGVYDDHNRRSLKASKGYIEDDT